MIIRIENRQIDFDGDFSFQLNNPMLTDSVSHSLQSTFEDTPEIREILGFINLPYIAENKTKELNATISLLGITYVGTIKVTYQNKKFSWYFKTTLDL